MMALITMSKSKSSPSTEDIKNSPNNLKTDDNNLQKTP